MNINYHVCDPTGNITVLVDSPVMAADQPVIASRIMQREPLCEQVGFISMGDEESDITLRMAGGEFCGNATMSAAALFCKKKGIKPGESKDVKVRVIGTKNPVDVNITYECGEYFGEVSMPLPKSISYEQFTYETSNYRYPVVDFGSISHVIIEDLMPIVMAERAIKQWCRQLRADGLGFMLLNKDRTSLNPLVYIPKADTLFWESSCASGTTAVGAYYKYRDRKEVSMNLSQPGGVLSIETTKDGALLLKGKVSI